MAPLYTVGHSTRSGGELLALLTARRIATLVDVRRFPASRRHPQFARAALEEALAGAGISYLHEPDLGGRRAPRPGSPHIAWRVAAFRGYADHMATPAFQNALARLIRRAAGERGEWGERVVVLCAEAVPWRCHRRLIADALVARGIEVLHILGPPPAGLLQHVLDPTARVLPGGGLIYDRPQAPPPPDGQATLPLFPPEETISTTTRGSGRRTALAGGGSNSAASAAPADPQGSKPSAVSAACDASAGSKGPESDGAE